MMKRLLLLLLPFIAVAQVTVVQAPVPKFRSFTPSGLPNVGGCVYTYASGTSTPQATYVDSTGLTANSNPVILDANGEAPIWISGVTYRFQVWTFGSGVIGSNCGNGTQLYQIDGVRDTGLNALNGPITIAPTSNGIDIFDLIRATDVSPSGNFVNFKSFAGATLFKVDINGNILAPSITTTGGGVFGAISGTTISGTTATLSGGTITATEVAAPSAAVNIDQLWADSTAHRWKANINNTGPFQMVLSGAGTDINSNDQIVQVHFGATATPLSGTAPTTGQVLQFNGTNIIGNTVTESTFGLSNNQGPLTGTLCTGAPFNNICNVTVLTLAHTLVRFTYIINIAPVTCSPNAVIGVRDITSSTNLVTSTVTGAAGALIDSGALSVAMTAGHTFGVGLLTAAAGCGTTPQVGWLTMVYE